MNDILIPCGPSKKANKFNHKFMKKTQIKVWSFLFLILGACTTDIVEPNESIKLEKTESFPAIFDQKTQSYSVSNFYDYDFTLVKELPVVPPVSASGRSNYVAPGGSIVTTEELIITQDGPTTFEKYATVPSGYIVTGVGALITTSSYNYQSIVLEYRYLYADGTLGTRLRVYNGSNLLPSQLEAWYAVPDGSAVWGIGVRGKYDVLNLSVFYREIGHEEFNPNQLQLIGGYSVAHSGLQADGENQIEYLPNNTSDGSNDYRIIQGLGLTSTSTGTTRMKIDIGYIKQAPYVD